MEKGEKSAGAGSQDAGKEQTAGKRYEDMTRKELYETAKAKGFKGISKYKKAQLLELLLSGKPAPSTGKKRPVRREPAGAKPDGVGEPTQSAEMPHAAGKPAAGDAALSEVAAQREAAQPAPPGPDKVYVDWGYPLPGHYGIDRISAVAKDPNWIFVHWDLSGNRRQEVAQAYGREIFSVSRWHLRVIDTGCGESVDFPINLDSTNWYLPVAEDKTFKVQIGIITPESEFIQFAETRETTTPRSRPSDSVSEKWMVADEQFQRFLRQAGAPGASELSSHDLAAYLREKLSR
jgi:hypothetical protein